MGRYHACMYGYFKYSSNVSILLRKNVIYILSYENFIFINVSLSSRNAFGKKECLQQRGKRLCVIIFCFFTLRLIGSISYLGGCYIRSEVTKCICEKMTLYFRGWTVELLTLTSLPVTISLQKSLWILNWHFFLRRIQKLLISLKLFNNSRRKLKRN